MFVVVVVLVTPKRWTPACRCCCSPWPNGPGPSPRCATDRLVGKAEGDGWLSIFHARARLRIVAARGAARGPFDYFSSRSESRTDISEYVAYESKKSLL